MKKRILTMFLAVCMIFTMVPLGALAEGTPLPEPATMGESASPSSFTITFDTNGGSGTAGPQAVADGGLASEPAGITKDGFTLEGWYRENTFVTLWTFASDTVTADTTLYANWIPIPSGVTTKEDLVTALGSGGSSDVILGGNITDITTQLNVGRDVILDLNGYNLAIATTGDNTNGMQIATGVTLTIRDSSAPSTGTLSVTHSNATYNVKTNNGAAINTNGATLVIESGTVTASTGSYYGAGIGGGAYRPGGTVTINGGTVTATGGISAAGIGGGYRGIGSTVTINGGTVTATGGQYGAGIGGGGESAGGTVTITGGVVTARSNSYGAGIGGGNNGAGGTVTISGGTVAATGQVYGAGIGGGGNVYTGAVGGAGGTVTISGGMVIAIGGQNGAAGIGGGNGDAPGGTLTITGGSVQLKSSSMSCAATPKETGGNTLYMATLTVKGDSSLLANTALDSTGNTIQTGGSDFPYGTKDVKTDANGKLYFWLPVNTYGISLMAGGTSYSNSRVIVKDTGGVAELRTQTAVGPEQALRNAAADGGDYSLPVSFDGQAGNEPILAAGLEIKNDFTLDLNGHNLTITLAATEGNSSNGIKIASGVIFTIKDSSSPSTGTLTVTNNASAPTSGNGAAINTSFGTLVIESGTVTAHGAGYAAGIGSGNVDYDDSKNLTGGKVIINGGTVTAKGGYGSAGIGSSYVAPGNNKDFNGGTLTITGGTVTASGGYQGAGIGGGRLGDGGTVKISGGTVIASGGYQGAGIGGGYSGYGGTLTITGGSVQAKDNSATGPAVPQNSGGSAVYLATLTIKGSSVANTALASTGHNIVLNGSPCSYSTKDVKTDASGNVYFWLPAATYGISLKVGSTNYVNNAVAVTAGSGVAADLTETTPTTPSNVLLSATSIVINTAPGVEIGTFSTIDMDGDEIFTYSLVSGLGSDHNNLFTIVGNSLRLGAALGSETESSLSIRVRTTDAGGAYYEKTFIITVINVPGAPTIGTATAGDGQATVAFTAPANNGGTAITGYTVTSSPGNITAVGTASPITVMGLNNGTAYTFTVTATNNIGTGAPSSVSNSVTPKAPQTITFTNPGAQNFGTTPALTASATSGLPVTFTSATPDTATITSDGRLTFLKAGTVTINADQAGDEAFLAAPQASQSFFVNPVVPGAPSIGTATAGDGQATVTFTAPASNGGVAITEYTVTASPGGATGRGTVSPITVTGLNNGTAYTFTVTATNSAGTGPASSASNSATPKAEQTITFTNPGAQNFGTAPTLAAVATSGLPVTFTSATPDTATITSDGYLTFLKAGTVTINADQAGDGAYLPAPQVSRSFTVNAVVPGAPIIGTVTAGDTSATVSFTPPAFHGGADITEYTVTSSPGNITATGTASPITVTGLNNGTAYTFTVTATNSAGTGSASVASNSVTPNPGPAVTSVGVPANGRYGVGRNLDFTVNFDQPVVVTGTPKIALVIGAATRFAQYQPAPSPPTALVFRYTVVAGEMDANGITVGSLALNGGTIQNAVGTDATLTLNSVGSTASVLVKTTAPTVSSVVAPPNRIYGSGEDVMFTVNFSEPVTVTGTPQIAISVGSSTAYAQYMSGSDTPVLMFRYTVTAGQEDSDGIALGTLTTNGGTIQDDAGNNANLTLNNVGNSSGVRVDGAAPAAPTIALAPSSDSGRSNSDQITNDTTPTLSGMAEAGSTVTLYEGATVIGTSTADASGIWSVTVPVFSDGGYAITATAADAMGNVSAVSAALHITVDTQAPTLSTSPADAAVDVAIGGNIVLTFGEAMDYTAPGTVQLDSTPRTGAWSAGNTIYTIPYSGLLASENHTLDIAGFRDIAGNTMAADISRSFTTAASVVTGDNDGDRAPRTLTDMPTGLSVTGALSSGATLRVNSFTPALNATDPALAAMRDRMDSLSDTMVFCADITVSGGHNGPLTLSFEVGSQYNGRTVTLLHAKNGKLTTYTAIVKNGAATFTVTSLSPFALFAPVVPLDVLDIPKTGDGGAAYPSAVAFGILALFAGAAVHNRRRKKEE